MKKVLVIIFSLLAILALYSGGSYLKESANVKKAVWEQFGSETKEFIKGTWRSGSVGKVTLNANMGNISDESYIGKEVYIISFTTKKPNPTINTIGVYASLEDYKIIGVGNVD
jgi:hypothetical protein